MRRQYVTPARFEPVLCLPAQASWRFHFVPMQLLLIHLDVVQGGLVVYLFSITWSYAGLPECGPGAIPRKFEFQYNFCTFSTTCSVIMWYVYLVSPIVMFLTSSTCPGCCILRLSIIWRVVRHMVDLDSLALNLVVSLYKSFVELLVYFLFCNFIAFSSTVFVVIHHRLSKAICLPSLGFGSLLEGTQNSLEP